MGDLLGVLLVQALVQPWHHARLFNRKLQYAPKRPKVGQAPLLDHLYGVSTAKGVFGTYNALSVIAYVLRSVEAQPTWCRRLAEPLQDFPHPRR